MFCHKSGEHGPCGRRRCWKIPFFIAAIVLIKSFLVLLLWNALVPDLFHGPVLTYLQALEITVLVNLMIGFRHCHGHHGFGRFLKHLPQEEREKILEEMRKR